MRLFVPCVRVARMLALERESNPDRRSQGSAGRAPGRVGAIVLASAATFLAGCGNSGSGSSSRSASASTAPQESVSTSAVTSSAAQKPSEKVPVANITVKSPVPSKPVPARYTCDGANAPLPLEWTKAPAGTAEVDVFIVSALPVKGKFVVAWAIAGLPPATRRLSSSRLPSGAVVGRNSFGQARYSLCPPKGSEAHYAVLVYAIPHKIASKPGFDPEALIEGTLVHVAPSEGESYLSYKRK